MSLNTWFSKGMTYTEYVENMQVNRLELEEIYQNVTFESSDVTYFTQLRDKNLQVITLTADWCGDAALCVPIMQRIAELISIELRFLIRDENLDLMDQYLTNGTARSIPIFIITNELGKELAVWGPRSPEVQKWVTEQRANLPTQDALDFQEKQKDMYAAFKRRITTDPVIWQSVISDIRLRLENQLNN